MLIPITLISIASLGVFYGLGWLTFGRTAMIDQQMQTMQSFGIKMSDAAVQRMEDGAAVFKVEAGSYRFEVR